MEMREKMNLFYESAIEVANQQSMEILREHTATMERLFEEYKKNKQDEMDMRYQIEEGKQRREQNRRISEAQTEHKRQLSLHQQEKREALLEVLRQDPRPGYHDDETRRYGVAFAGRDVHFRVKGNILTVFEVVPFPAT